MRGVIECCFGTVLTVRLWAEGRVLAGVCTKRPNGKLNQLIDTTTMGEFVNKLGSSKAHHNIVLRFYLRDQRCKT
jgi:hypothetical protein